MLRGCERVSNKIFELRKNGYFGTQRLQDLRPTQTEWYLQTQPEAEHLQLRLFSSQDFGRSTQVHLSSSPPSRFPELEAPLQGQHPWLLLMSSNLCRPLWRAQPISAELTNSALSDSTCHRPLPPATHPTALMLSHKYLTLFKSSLVSQLAPPSHHCLSQTLEDLRADE